MAEVGAGRRGRRRGVTLVVVAVFVMLVSLGATMLQRASRQRFWEVHREASATVALALAESGLNVTLENLREEARTPGTPFYEALVELPAEDLEGLSLPVENPMLALATEVLDDAALRVEVTFSGMRAFHSGEDYAGVARDLREKHGQMSLDAIATYRGVTRVFSVVRRVKVVDVTAPVLSKFTLYVAQQGDQEVNRLRYDRLRPNSPMRDGDGPARPLMLFHTRDKLPAVESGDLLPVADVLASRPPDAGGLVYLGGDRPWYLNLVHGGGAGPHEELFHLRRARMLADGDGVYDGRVWFGFYQGILGEAPLALGAPHTRPTGEPVPEATSGVHLYGDIHDASPTPVLGPVYRAYVRAGTRDGVWVPAGAGPDEASVAVVHEAYNRGYDYLVTNRERMTADGRIETDGETFFEPPASLTSERLTVLGPLDPGDEGFLYPSPGSPNDGACRLTRVMDDGREEPVFAGALADLDGALLADLLRSKAVVTVEDEVQLSLQHVTEGAFDPPGIALVREGGLEVQGRTVREACMILVEGDIRITGGVTQSVPGQVLTLVSLTGDIELATDEVVQAHLVAPQGQVRLLTDQVNLMGGVACQTLDLARANQGAGAKWIRYDPALDPTREGSYRAHLRVAVDEGMAYRITAR